MNDTIQAYDGDRSDERRNECNPSESQMTLRRALRTLRGIRRRCTIDHARNSDAHSLTVHVAFSNADMCWITAAIEAVEKTITAGGAETATSENQVNWPDDLSSCNVSAHGESAARR